MGRKLNLDTRTLSIYLAIFLVLSFVFPNVDWRAHIGGLITGVVVAAAFAYAPRQRRTEIQVFAGLAITAALGAVVLLRTAALTGGDPVIPMIERGAARLCRVCGAEWPLRQPAAHVAGCPVTTATG